MPRQPSIFDTAYNNRRENERIARANEIGPGWNDLMWNTMRDYGFASANRFLVLVMPNGYVRNTIGMNFVEDTLRLAVRCKSISLESQSFFTAEESTLSPGPVRVMPYKRNTANTTGVKLSYHMGADMFEKVFFESWFNMIQDPLSKRFAYYKDYALSSDCYLLLLPNMIQNVTQAMGAMMENKLTGFRLTEVYPYSYGVPSLQGGGSSEPLSLDVNLMYREILPLDGKLWAGSDGPSKTIPRISSADLRNAVQGGSLDALNETNRITRESLIANRDEFVNLQNKTGRVNNYRNFLNELNGDADIADPPAGVDGKLIYKTPRFGGLQLGLSLLSQTQGFFGAGYFGP